MSIKQAPVAGEIIRARRNPLLNNLLGRYYIRPSLQREFHSIAMSIDPQARQLLQTPPAKRPPVIFASAHPSWWDGHIAWQVEQALGKRDVYIMMDLISLRNYRFFTIGGAFSVDRDNPRSALASIDYISEVLRSGPNKAMWIFPQGTITRPEKRPLRFFPGVAHVVRRLDSCLVVPVAWRLEYRLEQNSEVFCRVGAPQAYDAASRPASREITHRLERAIEQLDDEIAAALAAANPKDMPPGFKPILRGRTSTHRNWDAVLDVVRRLRASKTKTN